MAPLLFATPRPERPPAIPPSKLDRVLSNSAAEFVETRAGRELCRRATGGLAQVSDEPRDAGEATIDDAGRGDDESGPKFVSSEDRFMPANSAPHPAQFYKASSEMVDKFQSTLQDFMEILETRNVFKKLGIAPRSNPAEYNLQYVLNVASQLKEHKEGQENTKTIQKFLRKCSSGIHNHSTALKGFLSMVPNDAYGAAISGGLSMILAAVESHEKSRLEVQTTLADIPRKLSNIQRLAGAQRKTSELYKSADEVFLAIFIVLQKIIDRLSKDFWEKGFSILKGHRNHIRDAIDTFDTKVAEFQGEVDVCAQYRLGRIESLQHNIMRKLGDIEKKLQITSEPDSQKMLSNIYTLLYSLCASSSNFNPKDGSFQRLDPLVAAKAIDAPGNPETTDNSIDKANELADSWFSGLGDFNPMPEKEINVLLSGIAELTVDEQDRVQWLLASENVQDWMITPKSSLLYIHAETAPEDLVNALSFSAATLALTLSTATKYPVLSFFCGLRRSDLRGNASSGPRAVRKSLNGQLLRFILDQREEADLSFLTDNDLIRKSKGRTSYANRLFRNLLCALPERDIVFIILDAFSRLGGDPGDKGNGDDIIEELATLKISMPQLVFKILVLDAMPSCPVGKLADMTLYVQDKVDGWRNNVNLEVLDQDNMAAIGQLVERQGKGFSSSEEFDSETSGSESD